MDTLKKTNTRTKFRAEYPIEFTFDYKDPVTLSKFLMDGGKIIPSRISKLSMAQQRSLTKAVKKARSLALLPLGNEAYDFYQRPEQISAKPVEI